MFNSSAGRESVRRTRTNRGTTAAYSLHSSGRAKKLIQKIKHALICCIHEAGKELNKLMRNIVSAYNIRSANDLFSFYKILYAVGLTCFRRHISNCAEALEISKDAIGLQEKKKISHSIVEVMNAHLKKATRSDPPKLLHGLPFNKGDHMIVAHPHHHITYLERKGIGPCIIADIRGFQHELVYDLENIAGCCPFRHSQVLRLKRTKRSSGNPIEDDLPL